MKREALSHTKMKRLCRRLDIPLWQGVGILETLWQLTAKQTPRGDVGRLSNEDIVIGLDYRENEENLIDALIESGWVDRDKTHRLLIHDWPDHAPDAVHMKLARQQQFFASGVVPKTNRLPKWERELAHSFFEPNIKEPLPRVNFVRTNDDFVRTNDGFVHTPCAPPPPPPPPSPDPPTKVEPPYTHPPPPQETAAKSTNGTRAGAARLTFAPSARFPDWWQLWSSVKGTSNRTKAEAAYRENVPTVGELDCFECTASYLESLDNPARGYHPHNFLTEQAKEKFKARWPVSTNRNRSAAQSLVDRTLALMQSRIDRGEPPI